MFVLSFTPCCVPHKQMLNRPGWALARPDCLGPSIVFSGQDKF
ncbi:MAG: hypothetical protein ACK55Z_08420 [bacterium]